MRTFNNSVAFYTFLLKLLFLFEKAVFFEKPRFFNWKNQILNTLRKLNISVAFCMKKIGCFLGIFHKNSSFFRKFENSIFFSRRNHFFNVWETLLFQLHPTTNFYLWRFSKKSIVSSRNPYIFFYKTDFWSFWEVLFFQSNFTASLLSSAFFWKKSIFFFKKPALIFHQKT